MCLAMKTIGTIALSLILAACGSSPPVGVTPASAAAPAPAPGQVPGAVASADAAPAFTLPDLEGKPVKLEDYRGKIVVLEWFNPECPFVRASHTKGSLKSFPREAQAKGVVWLAINSNVAGKQGHGVEKNVAGKQRYGIEYPILLDEDGRVGHLYGATNTPHMFVIDAQGQLAYKGAIDNSPDAEGESPEGGKLINYVEAAISDLSQGKRPAVKETKAYGCGVKY